MLGEIEYFRSSRNYLKPVQIKNTIETTESLINYFSGYILKIKIIFTALNYFTKADTFASASEGRN